MTDELQRGYDTARALATLLRVRHYPEADQWEPLPTLDGVLSQIDNMTVGMTRADFQGRVALWMHTCFRPEIANDMQERNHRFLEEALELVQSKGCTASEAHQLVDYVFGREAGDPWQEAGGVMVTLAALCYAAGLGMHEVGDAELARVWEEIDAIRRCRSRSTP